MTAGPPTDAERIAWLRLARTPNVGPVAFDHLLSRFGSAEAALDALPRLVQRGSIPAPPSVAEVESSASWRPATASAHGCCWPASRPFRRSSPRWIRRRR